MSTTYGLSYKKNYSGVQPGAVLSKVHKKTECSTSSTATSTASDKRFRGSIAARLYVGGLAWKTTEAELKHYFSSFGDVVDLRIVKDRETGFSRGFGFVTFESHDIALTCKKWCSANSPMICDRLIRVDFAEKHSEKAPRDKKLAGDDSASAANLPTSQSADTQEQRPTRLPLDKCYWQYKWSNDSTEMYGPYDTAQMQAWLKLKFFSSAVVVREVDANEYNAACKAGPDSETFELSGEFVPIGDIDFAMFP